VIVLTTTNPAIAANSSGRRGSRWVRAVIGNAATSEPNA